MIQSFQCPICGTLNALGEPECSECGQAFVYNCPVCGSPLNNRYPTCPNCHTIFNWGSSGRIPAAAPGPATPQAPEQQEVAAASSGRKPGPGLASYTARPVFWVTLIVICAVLIALLLILDGVINK